MIYTLLLALLAPSPDPLPPPNVLMIVADDLGWRDIDASIPTPTIDELGRRGITFASTYSNPNCSPSRYTMLFGRYSRRDGIGSLVQPQGSNPEDKNPSSPFDRLSIATLFKGKGYRTAAFGKWHVSNGHNNGLTIEAPRMHGFDTYRAGSITGFGSTGSYSVWTEVNDGVQALSFDYNTTVITDKTIDWWTGTKGPKFAYVAYNAPHAPFHRPPSSLLPFGYSIPNTTRGFYEAMTVALDTELARLLMSIDYSKTLVLFVSDNGTPAPAAAADQDPSKIKGSVYDGGVRVPMIAVGAGVHWSGVECDAVVNTTDFMATFAQLLHVKLALPKGYGLDSRSFADCFLDPFQPRNARRWVFSEIFSPNGDPFGTKGTRRRMIRNSTHKLMRNGNAERFFDMVNDPGETTPLGSGAGQAVLDIRDELRRQLAEIERVGCPTCP